MNSNKKLIVGIIVLVALLYTTFSIYSIWIETTSIDFCPTAGTDLCPHQAQLDFLVGALPIMLSVAIIAGAAIYYFMIDKVEKKDETVKNNSEVLLKFLNSDERKLINMLIESDGKILQAELTRLPGMTKVKSHRITQRLIDRGVIEKETLGKTNIIRFTSEIKEGLL